jgi:predicted alpha-1,6-mannanase (GH76 family)
MTNPIMRISPASFRILNLLAIVLFLSQMAYSQRIQHSAAAAPSDARRKLYLDHARKSIAALNKTWLIHSADSATWMRINAWQRFVIADSLVEYTEITDGHVLISDIELAVANKDGLDGNDDDLWAVIASLNLYNLNGSPSLLQYAQVQYKQLTDSYWDDTCGGGIWWDHARTYKNAITNELLLYAATLLYRATGDRAYYIWSFKEWNWFNHSGLINDRALINDGLDQHCLNNGQKTYTYNQGVILGALTNLYFIDKDFNHITMATRIAESAISDLSNRDGILVEPAEKLGQDGQIFKGIFVYHLGHLFQFISDSSDRKIISSFIFTNADYAWKHRKTRENEINSYWDSTDSLYGAAAQSAGISLFNAAVRISQ